MKPSDDIIRKFIEGSCTDGEFQLVKNYLGENPDALKDWITIEEWKSVNTEEALDPDQEAGMLRGVRRATVARTATRRMIWRVTAAAAAIVLAIVGIHSLKDDLASKQLMALRKKAEQLNYIENRDSVNKIISLADGSRIVLYTNSSVTVDSLYNLQDRRICLKGEADFYVANNPGRPFSVKSGDYSTTALGTSFKVIYPDAMQGFKVKLMSGKVKIEENHPGRKKLLCILSPGQEMRLNLKTMELAVSHFTESQNEIVKNKIKKSFAKTNASTAVAAEKESLALFLKKLSRQFDTRIVFDARELNNMSVTATFRNESLAEILEQIAILNNLSCEKKADHFVIGKK